MPHADSEFSSDYYLYKYLTHPLAERICFISPNFITLCGSLLIIPIVNNLLKKGSLIVFLSLMITRHFLDCLDGSVARMCNKYSRFGALFDVISDIALFLSICCVAIFELARKRKTLVNVISLIIILSFMSCLIFVFLREISVEHSTKEDFFLNNMHKIMHENMLIMIIIGSLFVKSIVSNRNR